MVLFWWLAPEKMGNWEKSKGKEEGSGSISTKGTQITYDTDL